MVSSQPHWLDVFKSRRDLGPKVRSSCGKSSFLLHSIESARERMWDILYPFLQAHLDPGCPLGNFLTLWTAEGRFFAWLLPLDVPVDSRRAPIPSEGHPSPQKGAPPPSFHPSSLECFGWTRSQRKSLRDRRHFLCHFSLEIHSTRFLLV